MFSPRNIRGVVISGVAVVAALTLTAGQSAAASGCFTVSGRYTEHAVTGPECRAPAGLCIAGTYRGDISGPPGMNVGRFVRCVQEVADVG